LYQSAACEAAATKEDTSVQTRYSGTGRKAQRARTASTPFDVLIQVGKTLEAAEGHESQELLIAAMQAVGQATRVIESFGLTVTVTAPYPRRPVGRPRKQVTTGRDDLMAYAIALIARRPKAKLKAVVAILKKAFPTKTTRTIKEDLCSGRTALGYQSWAQFSRAMRSKPLNDGGLLDAPCLIEA
jgi:hypothetical protein